MVRGRNDRPEEQRVAAFSTGRKILFAAGTLVVLLFVWAIGLEVAIRIFGIGPEISSVWRGNYRLSSDAVLGYELVPGSADGSAQINAHGMRDGEIDLIKPKGTIRVAVVGDSIAFGLGVTQEATFAARAELLLAKYFREEGAPKVEVLNFGVTGYSFEQILRTVRTKVMPFDPDVILYAYSLNDPQVYSLEMDTLLSQITDAEERYLLVDESRRLLDRSRLWRLLRYLGSQRERSERDRPVWDEDDPQFLALRTGRADEYFAELNTSPETWLPVESGLEEMASFAAAEGVTLRALIFPLLTDLRSYPIAEVHAHLRRQMAALGIPFRDLVEEFVCMASDDPEAGREGVDLAHDPLHPNARGHALVAVAVVHELVVEGLIPGMPAEAFERLEAAAIETVAQAHVVEEVARIRRGEASRCAPVVSGGVAGG